ncbi:MAG: hypothetical protein MJB14_11025 [Spirochaetes bacterium]|nr:hypothetical protein [Spirochaetota bacterium]
MEKPLLLIVDDHPGVLRLAVKRLKDKYKIVTSLNGLEALNALHNFEKLPDIIISLFELMIFPKVSKSISCFSCLETVLFIADTLGCLG